MANRQAPELKDIFWLDENGVETDKKYKLSDNKGKFQILFMYQHACPGCHISGFPTLIDLIEGLGDKVEYYAIQTAFEDFSHNSVDKLIIDKDKYNLSIPFGYDSGEGKKDNYPDTMFDFQTGGTPWFIIVNKENEVIVADFNIDPVGVIQYIKENI